MADPFIGDDPLLERAQPTSSRDSDVDYEISISRELWLAEYPRLPLRVLDRTASPVHQLYRETAHRVYKPADPASAPCVPCYVDPSPSSYRLAKYGIEGTRALLVYFHIQLLEEAGIRMATPTTLIHALIEYDGQTYELLNQHRPKESLWLNTAVPVFLVCDANIYGGGS